MNMLVPSQPSSFGWPVSASSLKNFGSLMTREMLLLSNIEMIQ
jgi:hypothetical protein